MATLKHLMTLFSRENILEKRGEIIYSWTGGRTSSAKALTSKEINEMCLSLEKASRTNLDKKRKRVIASIFGFYKKMNRKVDINYVKATACRAAGADNFNQIPSDQLSSIYNAFIQRQKDLDFTGRIVEGYISEQKCYN